MSDIFVDVINEIKKYSLGVHQLNTGISENEILNFEDKYDMNIPDVYKNG